MRRRTTCSLILVLVIVSGVLQSQSAGAYQSTPDAAGLLEHEVLLIRGDCASAASAEAVVIGIARPEAGIDTQEETTAEESIAAIITDVPRSTLTTTVDRELNELVRGDFALVARGQSATESPYVVCGELTADDAQGRVTIDLAPTEGSPVNGSAVLRAVDGSTRIAVALRRDSVYVTAVPVDLEPGRIVLFMIPSAGVVEFVVFNQRVEGPSTLAISGPGIDGVRDLTVETGEEAYLLVALEPGVYRLSCPECGERADEVVLEIDVVQEDSPSPTP